MMITRTVNLLQEITAEKSESRPVPDCEAVSRCGLTQTSSTQLDLSQLNRAALKSLVEISQYFKALLFLHTWHDITSDLRSDLVMVSCQSKCWLHLTESRVCPQIKPLSYSTDFYSSVVCFLFVSLFDSFVSFTLCFFYLILFNLIWYWFIFFVQCLISFCSSLLFYSDLLYLILLYCHFVLPHSLNSILFSYFFV